MPTIPMTTAARTARAAALAAAFATAAAAQQGQTAEKVDGTRATLEKWVETRRVLSKERRDWQLGRELLDERIAIVQREIDGLRAKIAEAEQSITEADKKKASLVAENEQLVQAAAGLASAVARLEERTRKLLPRVPEPVRALVQPLSQALPPASGETKLSLGQRYMNVVGILNQLNKFHREITVASEVRTLGNGATAEVTTIYLGCAVGYYVTAKGDAAGVGTATADGWQWTPRNEIGPRVQQAIAVFKNEQVAAYVQLPLQIL